jgi:hypothetical protein
MSRASQGIVLVLLGTTLAVPYFENRNVQPLSRNRYTDLDGCLRDYDSAQCKVDGGNWYGPWYLADAARRTGAPNDPGPGRYFGGGYYGGYGGGIGRGFAATGSETGGVGPGGPVSVESGYRSGFGGTAHVGRAGG